MNQLSTTFFTTLFFVAQAIGATNVCLPDHPDYYVIVLPPKMANGCKIYQVRVYDKNGTPLDKSDDTLVASGAIEDCPGNGFNSVEYIGTIDKIFEIPDRSRDGAVLSIYNNEREFIVKGTILIHRSE